MIRSLLGILVQIYNKNYILHKYARIHCNYIFCIREIDIWR